jgi:hypothetical protein
VILGLNVTFNPMGPPPKTPLLGPDKILRFDGVEQYAAEWTTNLSEGRTFARIGAGLKIESELTFQIQHPVSKNDVQVIGRVVFKNESQVGLELRNFNDRLKEQLESLAQMAEDEPPENTTINEEDTENPFDEIPDALELLDDEPAVAAPQRRARSHADLRKPRPSSARRGQRKRPKTGNEKAIRSPLKPKPKNGNSRPSHDSANDVSPPTKPDTDFSIPHLDRRSKLIIEDSFQLLGLYVSQLRHGYLTYRAEKDAEIDDVVTIRLVCGHTIGLTGDLVKKEGHVQTVKLDDTWSVEALLRETSSEWIDQIKLLTGEPKIQQRARHRDATVATPMVMVEEQTAQAAGTKTKEDEPAVSPPPPEEAFKPPRLENNAVHFDNVETLKHEFENNLRNGGLAVQSEPIPIREHRTLKIVVGTAVLPIELEADVVFANNKTVGFHISNLSELINKIESYLSGSPGTDTSTTPSNSKTETHFSGRIIRPFGLIQLVDIGAERTDNHAELARCNVLLIVDYLARHEQTGVLALNRKEDQKVVYFQDGNLVFVECEPDDDERCRLGKILLHHKKISEPALREALDGSEKEDRPVGQTLVSLGHIKPQTLAAALREQMRMKLESAFDWTSGTYQFSSWKAPNVNAELVVTRGMSILTRRIRYRLEHITTNEMEALYSPSATRKIQSAKNLKKIAQGMGLQQKELRFLTTRLGNVRSLRESITGSPLGRLGSLRVIALSMAMDLITFEDGKGAAMGRKAKPRKPTYLRDQDALKKSLKEHLELMSEQNHFEVLGIHWSASHRSFTDANKKIKMRFNFEQGPIGEADRSVKEIARQIHLRIDDAFKILNDRQNRMQYRKKLFDATERQYAAEMLIKQGEVLVMRGDHITGLEAFETAYELAPSNKIKALLEAAREGE